MHLKKSSVVLILTAIIITAGISTAYLIFKPSQNSNKNANSNTSEITSSEQVNNNESLSSNQETDKNSTPDSDKTSSEMDSVKPTIAPTKDYSQLYPNLYATRPAKQISQNKTIYLTFDDGPSERTAEILDILKQNNIKATFFVIGNKSDQAKELMKRIVAEGHTIAPHTYTHEFKQIYSSVEAYLEDFNKIYNLIYENTGVKSTIFRFAGGSKNGFNKNNYRDIIAEMTRRGFDYFDWNLSTGDAVKKTPTPAVTCISNVTKNSANYNTAVILAHDAAPKKTTVEALPGLIKELKAQGFKFDKLSNNISPVKHSLIKPYA